MAENKAFLFSDLMVLLLKGVRNQDINKNADCEKGNWKKGC